MSYTCANKCDFRERDDKGFKPHFYKIVLYFIFLYYIYFYILYIFILYIFVFYISKYFYIFQMWVKCVQTNAILERGMTRDLRHSFCFQSSTLWRLTHPLQNRQIRIFPRRKFKKKTIQTFSHLE